MELLYRELVFGTYELPWISGSSKGYSPCSVMNNSLPSSPKTHAPVSILFMSHCAHTLGTERMLLSSVLNTARPSLTVVDIAFLRNSVDAAAAFVTVPYGSYKNCSTTGLCCVRFVTRGLVRGIQNCRYMLYLIQTHLLLWGLMFSICWADILGTNPNTSKVQNGTLFIRTKHNMRIFGE